jgi:rhodanese-related sulfurtransferase
MTDVRTPSLVRRIPAASPAEALAHFQRLLAFETDCSDVHAALETSSVDFVLLDVRSRESSLPYREIDEAALSAYPGETLFVVYCDGPHCNGADHGAARIATLDRPVKKMIGGVAGWKDDGFVLATAEASA